MTRMNQPVSEERKTVRLTEAERHRETARALEIILSRLRLDSALRMSCAAT